MCRQVEVELAERRTTTDIVRLENHYSPRELERAIARFVAYCSCERLHEGIGNVTPDDMHRGRQREILTRREEIERLTLEHRKKQNLRNAAWPQSGERILASKGAPNRLTRSDAQSRSKTEEVDDANRPD